MQLSGYILLDPVKDLLSYQKKSPLLKKEFSCILRRPFSEIPMERKKLYLVSAQNAKEEAEAHPEISFITIDPKGEVQGDGKENLLVLSGEMPEDVLLDRIQNRFLEIQDWYDKLQHAVIYGVGLQQLLDMSENIIGQYIAISDYSLRLLAYTKNIPCECEVCRDLRENGVHTGRTLEVFRKSDRFRYWAEHEFYVDDSLQITPYALAGAVYRYGSTYFNHAVMTMDTPELNESAIGLFRIFSECIRPIVTKDWEKADRLSHLYDGIIMDLIQGKLENSEVIETRARYANIPSKGRFMLFVCPVSLRGGYSIGQLGNQLNSISDSSWVVYSGSELIYLQYFEELEFASKLERICDKVRNILKEYVLTCGVSSRIDQLDQIRIAYLQAKYALSVLDNRKMSDCALKEQCVEKECFYLKQEPLMLFNNVFDFCFCDCSHEKLEMLSTSRYYRALQDLRNYDMEHKTNNLQLLRVYLESERRVQETAERMHMHRNNIAYRIQKIRDIIDLDLDDYRVRFRIMETYLILNKASRDQITLFNTTKRENKG